jgi:hypothetical protein
MRGRLQSVSARLFGEPPGRDSSRLARLCWIRRMYLVTMLIGLPVYVFLFVFASATWVFVVVGAGIVVWLEGLLSTIIRIRNERRREAS